LEPNFRGLPVKHPLKHRTRSLDYAVVLSGGIDDISIRSNRTMPIAARILGIGLASCAIAPLILGDAVAVFDCV